MNPLLLIVLATAAFAADSSRTESPVLGYVYERGELLAMLGVPGASTWSDAIALPDSVSSLVVAPGHRWALATTGRGPAVLRFDTMSCTALAAGPVDAAVFSPTGAAVAIRQGDVARVYTGLPTRALAQGEFDVAAFDALAVSDDGVLAGAQGSAVMTLDASGAKLRYRGSAAGPFGFFPASRSLVILDGAKLIESSEGEVRVIADGLDAAQVLLAGDVVTLASRDAARVWRVQRQTGAVAAIEVPDVTRLEPMRINGLLLLAAEAGQPAWLLTNEGVGFTPAKGREQ